MIAAAAPPAPPDVGGRSASALVAAAAGGGTRASSIVAAAAEDGGGRSEAGTPGARSQPPAARPAGPPVWPPPSRSLGAPRPSGALTAEARGCPTRQQLRHRRASAAADEPRRQSQAARTPRRVTRARCGAAGVRGLQHNRTTKSESCGSARRSAPPRCRPTLLLLSVRAIRRHHTRVPRSQRRCGPREPALISAPLAQLVAQPLVHPPPPPRTHLNGAAGGLPRVWPRSRIHVRPEGAGRLAIPVRSSAGERAARPVDAGAEGAQRQRAAAGDRARRARSRAGRHGLHAASLSGDAVVA